MKYLFQKFKKKPAISFAEVAVVGFLLVAIVCMFLGKVFDISQESDVIYKWKKVLASAQYSYDVLLLTKKNDLEQSLKLSQPQRDGAILELFKTTLNLDTVNDKLPEKSLKSYKYRFLNGLSVSSDTKYYVQKMGYSPDKRVLVGINWFNDKCLKGQDLCGIIVFDLNGTKMPNRFGLDVFGVNIYGDRLEPFGTGLSYQDNEKNCRRLETGVTCSKFYLMGGQFFK